MPNVGSWGHNLLSACWALLSTFGPVSRFLQNMVTVLCPLETTLNSWFLENFNIQHGGLANLWAKMLPLSTDLHLIDVNGASKKIGIIFREIFCKTWNKTMSMKRSALALMNIHTQTFAQGTPNFLLSLNVFVNCIWWRVVENFQTNRRHSKKTHFKSYYLAVRCLLFHMH
jgi:hypothetical protein